MSIYSKLFKLQQAYASQKTGYNKFGNYNFRNAEQMLNELKPLFNELNLAMVFKEEYLQDDYIKCIGTLIDVENGETYSTESVILVDRGAKGMQLPQCVGSAVSYGRKYLLGGLLSVTDSATDPDAINDNITTEAKPKKKKDKATMTLIKEANDKDSLMKIWNSLNEEEKQIFQPILRNRREELGIK